MQGSMKKNSKFYIKIHQSIEGIVLFCQLPQLLLPEQLLYVLSGTNSESLLAFYQKSKAAMAMKSVHFLLVERICFRKLLIMN